MEAYMTVDDLKTACVNFEHEHGVEAFIDALANIMQDRLRMQGLLLDFSDDLAEPTHPESLETDSQH
jgi:hypothetical protein